MNCKNCPLYEDKTCILPKKVCHYVSITQKQFKDLEYEYIKLLNKKKVIQYIEKKYKVVEDNPASI